MKRIFTLTNLVLLVAVLLAGCTTETTSPRSVTPETTSEKVSEYPIVGRWISEEKYDDGVGEFTFFADGTMIAKGENRSFNGTYSFEGNQMRLFLQKLGDALVDYNINGENLAITADGETRTFRKAK